MYNVSRSAVRRFSGTQEGNVEVSFYLRHKHTHIQLLVQCVKCRRANSQKIPFFRGENVCVFSEIQLVINEINNFKPNAFHAPFTMDF